MHTNTKIPSPRELQLLSLVLVQRTGREIARLFQHETGAPIAYGTLYTTFRRMKESGWVSVREKEKGDGRERLFEITGAGANALEQGRAFYRRLADFSDSGSGAPGGVRAGSTSGRPSREETGSG
jgi:DNA-binding PadR family transcriptional regulator